MTYYTQVLKHENQETLDKLVCDKIKNCKDELYLIKHFRFPDLFFTFLIFEKQEIKAPPIEHCFHPADEVYERFWLKALTNDLERLNHAMQVLRKLGYAINIDTTTDERCFILDIQKSTTSIHNL